MEEKTFFSELELLLKDIPSKDKDKIISDWKKKWASVQSEKDIESFLTPEEIVQNYFSSHNNKLGKPVTYQFHPSLQVEEETKGGNQKENTEGAPLLVQNSPKIKKEEKEKIEEKKKKKRNPFVLIVTFPLWMIFLGIILFVSLLFTVGYGAFFLGVISVILYSLFTLVCAVFQGIQAQIFQALFLAGSGILLAIIAILSVTGMNLIIKGLWKGFKKANHFVFIGGKSK